MKPKRKPAIWTQLPQYRKRSLKSQRRLQRLRDKRQYTNMAHEFITDALIDIHRQWCPVARIIFLEHIRVSETHHIRGRAGKLLLDKRFWMAVSHKGHRYIHDHPKSARLYHWIAEPGDWNKQP